MGDLVDGLPIASDHTAILGTEIPWEAARLVLLSCTTINRLAFWLVGDDCSEIRLFELWEEEDDLLPSLTHLSLLHPYPHTHIASPSVTHLHIKFDTIDMASNMNWPAVFENCPRLTHLHLSGHVARPTDDLQLLVDTLPESLATLILTPRYSLDTPALRPLIAQAARTLKDARIVVIVHGDANPNGTNGIYFRRDTEHDLSSEWGRQTEVMDTWEFAERCMEHRKSSSGANRVTRNLASHKEM